MPGNSLVVVEHWSLVEDGAGGERCVIVAGFLSPNRSTRLLIYVTYETEMVWALYSRLTPIPRRGDAVLLVEHNRHTL